MNTFLMKFLAGALAVGITVSGSSVVALAANHEEGKRPFQNHWEQKVDDKTAQQLNEIRTAVKEGTLTREEAREKMAELGIEKPFEKRGHHHGFRMHGGKLQ